MKLFFGNPFLLRQLDAVEMRPVGEGAQGTREASRVVLRIQVLKRKGRKALTELPNTTIHMVCMHA